MTVQDIKKDIKAKCLKHLYIFTGEEVEVRKIYLLHIIKALNAQARVVDSLSDIYVGMNKTSLIERPTLFISYFNKEFQQTEKVWTTFKNYNGPHYVVFIYDKLDNRGKFAKMFKDATVEFDFMGVPVLKKYLAKEGCEMSDRLTDKLITICESNYGRLLLEFNKIKIYAEEKGISQDAAFSELDEIGGIFQAPQDVIFDYIDCVCKRNKHKAYDLMDESNAYAGVLNNTVIALSLLFSSFKHIYQYQVCESSDISASTGMTGFEIRQAKDRAGHFSNDEILDIMRLIQKTESMAKTGGIPMEFALAYTMAQILR